MVARLPLVVPLVAGVAFVVLLLLVGTGWPPLERADTAVSEALRSYGTDRPGLIDVLRVATDIAATWAYLLTGAVATLGLLARRQRRPALFCAIVTAVVPLLWGLAHWLLHRPRPVDGFVVVDSNGFPSGHTSNAAAAALVAVLLLWPRLGPTGRAVTVAVAAGVAGFVAATRFMLLAHWPTDVLGGWLLALTVVPLAAHAVTRQPSPA
ncbi:phosphatase PAP2 family protein, partial [Micromonospora echinofusca]